MANIDCLVCHDTTGTYSKKKNSCGYPDKGLDLTHVAKNVGMPTRQNCGTCHWYGGGGDNAKHGDLSSDLAHPDPELDVHMGGENFTCQKCHVTEAHKIAGNSTTSAVSEGSVTCTDCHDSRPHDTDSPLLNKLNDHGSALSCQACHIPVTAQNKMTLTYIDSSRISAQTQLVEKTANKMEIRTPGGYKIKERHLKPTYAWYNGTHRRYLRGDTVNLNKVTDLNPPVGNIDDPSARITPYKIMESVQAADAEFGYLIVPHLTGKDGLFTTHDWKLTAEKGMKAAGMKFSGKIAFANTRMFWRLNHGVLPKENALTCLDCHAPDGVMDFKSLGYKGDPAQVGKRSIK